MLGKTVVYTCQYDASLLFPIARSGNRKALAISDNALPFHGVDIWNAWEVSWLNPRGKPVVARAVFSFPASSTHLIESKSFKLYLNSFNGSSFDSAETVQSLMQRDLSAAARADVQVQLFYGAENGEPARYRATGLCLDQQDIDCNRYEHAPELLALASSEQVTESVYSQLLKSNCPVTGQPDWATLFIDYQGPHIDHAALLRYIVSFRNHAEFHEHCVEQIFVDLMAHCHCQKLTVYARYTRRGGLDINPWRSTEVTREPKNIIVMRQ